MVTEMGGDIRLLNGTLAKDPNTDLQPLRLMTKVELKPAMTMLTACANSGEQPNAQDLSHFKQMTGGDTDRRVFGL